MREARATRVAKPSRKLLGRGSASNGAVLVLAVLLAACGSGERGVVGVGPAEHAPPAVGDPCVTPREGCPCSEPDAVVECGVSTGQDGTGVTCATGGRRCLEGAWGACELDSTQPRAHRPNASERRAPGLHTLALASGSASCDDPCDPYCRTVEDTPDGLDPGDGLVADPDGVSLTQGGDGGGCAAFTITPPTATVTITALNADGTLVATPSQSVAFTATCDASGLPVTANWSLGGYDRAVIDGTGTVTVFSGIAGPLTVTADNALSSATATLNVVVDEEHRGSSVTVASAFLGSGPTGSARTLYPYRNTVFPLDLKAPLVQWSTGGNAASDVEVGLRYPAGSSDPTFFYSKIYNGGPPKDGTLASSMPAWRPPQQVWTAFGRTAALGATATERTGDIILQRRYGNQVHGELVIPVTFATEPLLGTVFYTQYLRTLFNPGSSSVCSGQTDLNPSTYTPGFVCPVGNCTHPGTSGTSSTLAIELSNPSAPNIDPFNGSAGCPVCHAVSADGATYVSGGQYWQTSGGGTSLGIDSIELASGAAASFSPLGAAPNYDASGNDFDASWPTEQSRGFAYSAITPDGALVLQAASFWGNTVNTAPSNNTQDATVKGVTGHAKPYFAVATANPGRGVMFATTGTLPSYGTSGNVLTASSNGSLTVDGQTLATGYSLLVKNETSTKAKWNGIYVVSSAGSSFSKWKLTRRDDADTSGDFVRGMAVRVSDGNTNRGASFTLANTGSISLNSTALTFSGPTFANFPSMMVPAFSPDGRKVVYVNADKDSISGYPDTGWRRGLSMFDFDQSTLAITGRKRLLNTWSSSSAGTPMKWPFFESDSRSIVYVETDPNEFCSSNSPGTGSAAARACQEAAYGSMSPTTRGYWPGKIYSIDSERPSSTHVELSAMTNGEDSSDAAKSYQPTVLPFAAGGYRWAIFTSPRAYGNQLNARASAGTSTTGTPTDFTCAASMLWVAAIDDTTADGTDRSHPAFFLPGQNAAPITDQNHYVNERGYLVPSLCKSAGESCTRSVECCGAGDTPPSTACRVVSGWTPAAGAPSRTCQTLSGSCAQAGEGCDSSADCCAGATCVNFSCSSPPSYSPATFQRDYVADCQPGELPHWQLFEYHLATPGDSELDFSAQTAATTAELDAATPVSLGVSRSTVEAPAAPESQDVGGALEAANQSAKLGALRISITLSPSSDGLATPVLEDWQMTYACAPDQ
jgi:hypothetical protein